MDSRPADVFFYGLFMDPDLLRAEGYAPQGAELASVPGFALRIGKRAALVPDRTARAHGAVMSLTLAELDRLYSQPSLQAYRPEPVLAHLASGGIVAALCYNLPEPPPPGDRSPEYASKLYAVGQKLGLPAEYLASLRMTASPGKPLHGVRMRAVGTAQAGAVDRSTLFHFSQRGTTIWARYAGGAVELGYLVGSVASGRFVFRYSQVDRKGDVHGGRSVCDVTLLPDGRVRLLEHFHWESRDGSGTNVLEEVAE